MASFHSPSNISTATHEHRCMRVRDGASYVSEGHVDASVYAYGIMASRCSGGLCAAHMLPPSVLLPLVIDRVTSLFLVPLKQAVSHLYGDLVLYHRLETRLPSPAHMACGR